MEVDLTLGPPPAPEVEPGSGDYVDDGFLEEGIAEAPHVDESLVRTALRSFGGGLSYVVGRDDVEDHWQFTSEELDDLTPPLTRYINKRPKVRAAVARGDEAAIGIVLASYTGRNVAAARRAQVEEEKAKHANVQREAERAQSNAPTGTPRTHEGFSGGQNGSGISPTATGGLG